MTESQRVDVEFGMQQTFNNSILTSFELQNTNMVSRIHESNLGLEIKDGGRYGGALKQLMLELE